MSKSTDERRVVITGLGAVTPLGIGADPFWEALKEGRSGIGPVTLFEPRDDLRIRIAGEVKDYSPQRHLQSKKLRQADRYSQFAGTAAAEAMADSGLDWQAEDGARAASILGSGIGGQTTQEFSYKRLLIDKRRMHPLTVLRLLGSSAPAHLSIEYGITGPTFGVVSACASGAHAMGLVARMIRDGSIDWGIAGGSEATLTLGTMLAWQAMSVLSEEACRPFSGNRDGTVLAEGAGIFVLEEKSRARKRGANIHAEILGFGMSSDAADMVNPSADGAAAAMRGAIAEAGLNASEIDYINAHGTATPMNDPTETKAIRMVFGDAADAVSISSTKSMHGHLLGAGGSVETIAAIRAIRDGVVPPTIGLDEPDPECDLDYTPFEARERKIRYALSNSFAFGGLNVALLFGAGE